MVMREITVSDDVYHQVRLLANAWQLSNNDALARLLDQLRSHAPSGGEAAVELGSSSRAPYDPLPPGTSNVVVPVFARYLGKFIEANFHWPSNNIEITSGPCAGKRFRSPSGAATEIVKTVNPGIKPNRNGWDFFQKQRGLSLREVRVQLAEAQR
ncbi:hypothetical protein [Amycolatopsis vastitatis]|uniref:Uncharacterized protein n=1 Tax=Amycolatopsis vastitatis TaxID=1905142 RepID=A0A229TEB6_9PSEU|nr:hypothetical protein [Amycolatopsis vastitatis]OXM69602.1 hypothetical protein CF165_08825 [Amycolatopsis vastitatis]